jgi:hypothetical protein
MSEGIRKISPMKIKRNPNNEENVSKSGKNSKKYGLGIYTLTL